jgi:pimeloyl-ACP methyl ester carboxylesterase
MVHSAWPMALLPLLQAPTLIICGELEEPDAAARAHAAAQAMPSGRSVIVPGAGHLEAFWRTGLTAPLIRGFLHDVFPASTA